MDESRLSLRGLALLALAAPACFTGAASAQTATFGFGCTYEGHSTAQGGTVGALVNNLREYSGTTCFGGNAESRGTYYGLRWTGDYPFEYSFAQHGLTQSSANAGFASLHAYSHSAAQGTPKEWWYTDSEGQSQVIANQYTGYGWSNANAWWFDQLTVEQGTAPYGRIYLRYTIQLHGSETTFGPTARAEIYARLSLDDDRNWSDGSRMLDTPGTVSFDVGYYPGTVVKVVGDLGVMTEARAGGIGYYSYVAEAEAFANAANSAGFQIEVLTPGASYTTASGLSYTTMVPEPRSAVLMALGLAVFAAWRRWRNSL